MDLSHHLHLMNSDLRAAVSGFSWQSRQVRMALKTAVVCVFAVLITLSLNIEDAFWAGISALIMMKPNVAATFQKGWMRAGGACVGSGLSIVVTSFFIQSPLGYSIAIFSLATAGFYFGTTLRSGYFWGYMFGHIALISMISVMDSDLTIHVAFYRASAVSIGVVVSCLINILLWPEYAYEELNQRGTEFREEFFGFVDDIMDQYLMNRYSTEAIDEKYQRLCKQIDNHAKLIEGARVEKRLARSHLTLPDKQIEVLGTHVHRFMMFYGNLLKEKDLAYAAYYKEMFAALMDKLKEWVNLSDRSDQKRQLLSQEIDEDLLRIKDAYTEKSVKEKGIYSIFDIMLFHEAVYCLKRFYEDLSNIDLSDEEVPFEKTKKMASVQVESDTLYLKIFGRFFSTNLLVLKYSIKSGLGILAVFWLWLWAEIPGGGLNMSVAVITVFQLDLMMTHQRGILRFLGCLIGGALGLFILGFQIDSTFIMFLIIFLCIFPLAYIWGSGPNVAYFGVQAGLALMVALLHEAGPATSIAPAIERLVGIFLGVLCIWTINLLLWPQDLTRHLDEQLEAVKDKMIAMGSYLDRFFSQDGRGTAAKIKMVDISAVMSTLDALQNQSELPVEKCLILREWLERLKQVIEEIADLSDLERAPVPLLKEIDPDFGPRLSNAVKQVARAGSVQEVREQLLEADDLIKMTRDLAEKLRLVTTERDILFKQLCSHYLLSFRRIIFGLKSMLKLQAQLISRTDNIPEGEVVRDRFSSLSMA